ncbi:probable transcriptional regulatory protein TTE1135 isoform X1 [Drosophila nasuta]|uniref:probable transcriptional regulatory protein TTE1135 isoform X1 n=1 Tax=Drosophila nasuta TaxID=42062 RepID=UPI00295EAFB6|nr:probable transcriptional regulatory protein TTE1135 isoform X1 [Drosophila nasuta]
MFRRLFLIGIQNVKIQFNQCDIRGMAGHSKWANIKHIKAQKDGQRAALFTKISRQIRLAVQEGKSADPAVNSLLRSEIDHALKKNMPIGTIQNTIKKCQGNKAQLRKHRLDIRFKRNVYLICSIYTDNIAQVKMDSTAMIKKSGGVLVDVGHMFEDFGLIETRYDSSTAENLEEKATEDAIQFGAEEVEVVDAKSGLVNFICTPAHLTGLSKTLSQNGYSIENSEHMFTPNNLIQLAVDDQKAYDVFLQKLRDVPGMEDIYDNVE